MEIRQLHYFVEIVKSESFSIAAQNLFVTQPTLSWNMSKLEEELGTKLLYQNGNKVVPTTVGVFMFEKSVEIIEKFNSMIRSIESMNNHKKKEIAIGSNTFLTPFFLPLILQFMEIYPNFLITIDESGSLKTQKKIVDEKLEIGIVSFPIVESQLEIKRNGSHSFQYDVRVVMRATHPLADREEIVFEELKDEKFASLSKDYALSYFIDNNARKCGFIPKINFISNNHELLINNILNSASIAILPLGLKKYYEDKELLWLPLKEQTSPLDIVIIHKKNKSLTPAAALCMEFLINNKVENPLI